jgi:hypothetical protein
VHMEEHIADLPAAAPEPAVLALHIGAGVSGYAATDRVPESIATGCPPGCGRREAGGQVHQAAGRQRDTGNIGQQRSSSQDERLILVDLFIYQELRPMWTTDAP